MQKLSAGPGGGALRAPQTLVSKQSGDDPVTFESYDDTNYGYLRLVVDANQLRIEYHPASDGAQAKTPDDSVTVDLASRTTTPYVANNLGLPAAAAQVRRHYAAQPGAGKRRPSTRSSGRRRSAS